MGRRKFIEYIREFRAHGKIRPTWTIREIRPLLRGIFSDNTIGVYPNNLSMSPDGKAKGDAVRRGIKPQFFRIGRGMFMLVEDFADSDIKGGYDDGGSRSRRMSRTSGADAITRRLTDVFSLKEILIHYGDICAHDYRRFSVSYYLYQCVILRHRFTRIESLVSDDDFLSLAYRTLEAWDMNYRNAKLVSLEEFRANVKRVSPEVISLSSSAMDTLEEQELAETASRLGQLFKSLKVMESKSQIVGCSKALHFLLPRLVMPVDGKYTLNFLFNYRKYQPAAEAQLFTDIFCGFYALSRRLGLSRADEQEIGWNSTVPKIIDNAIIGYTKDKNRGGVQKNPGGGEK